MYNDLIHRSAALVVLEELKKHVASPDPVGEVADAIETMRKVQAVDAEPVRHGRWESCFEDWRHQIEGDKCSVCGVEFYGMSTSLYNYCPNCGAKMDAEVKGCD